MRLTPSQAIIIIITIGIVMFMGSVLLAVISPVEAGIMLIATIAGLFIIWRPEIGFLLMIISLGVESIVIGAPVTIFRMLGILTFGTWLLRELIAKRFSFAKTPQNLCIAGFIFTAILSVLFADAISLSLVRVFTFIQLFFLYLLVVSLVNSERKLNQVVWIWVISATAASLYAIALFMWEELPRAVGGIRDPNDLVLYLLIPIALTAYLFQMEKSNILKVFLGVSFGIFLAVTVVSFSRGGFIAVLFLLGLLFLKSPKKKSLVALILITALFLTPILPFQVWFDRIETIVDLDVAKAGRGDIWEGGVRMFLHNFIFGVGVGNFRFEYRQYGWIGSYEGLFAMVAHNAYVEIAAEQGVFGLLFFLLLIWLTYKDLRKTERFLRIVENYYISNIAQALQIGFLSFLVGIMFLSQQHNKSLWLVVGLAVAIKMIYINKVNQICTGINSVDGNSKE